MQLKLSDGRAFQPTLHVGFLKTCLNNIVQCLREWKIASKRPQKHGGVISKDREKCPKAPVGADVGGASLDGRYSFIPLGGLDTQLT
jgi:hypothetical protein